MSALLLFVGVVIGVALTIIGGLVIVHWPEPEREPPRYSAIGAGRARTTGPEDLFEAIDHQTPLIEKRAEVVSRPDPPPPETVPLRSPLGPAPSW